MIVLGFQLLHLFPWMRRFTPRMPKFLAHKIHDMSAKETKGGAFILGASTFFLPCGFTQALQLYVLANGSFATGALTMLAFSLGTLPALLSLGFVSSFAKGTSQRYFVKFAGVLVILFGVFNVNNGLALTGSTFDLFGPFVSAETSEPTAPIVDGKQIVKMKVSGYTYSPHRFTVVQGIPVVWQIDGSGAVGCAQVLIMPTTGIAKYLPPQGVTTVTFTPTETGTIPFNCSMGMMTRGSAFTVIPNTTGIVGAPTTPDTESNPPVCDPTVTTCLPAQKFDMEISAERGFFPNSFTVKPGVPVEVKIDDKVQLGGCMTVMVIPQYQVTLPLKLGVNTLKFTPIESGPVFATCSMGTKMILFNVVG